MYRRCVVIAMFLVALVLLPLGASAQNYSDSHSTKTYKSLKCSSAVNPYDFASWACTTVIVPPQMVAGQTADVTFLFKAKTKLKNVEICFSQIASAKSQCAYHRKYAVINKGSTIKRVLHLIVPMVAQPGTYVVDNYTKFYVPPKGGDKSLYWVAHSFAHVDIPAA